MNKVKINTYVLKMQHDGFNKSDDNNECVKIDELSKESTHNIIETYNVKTSNIKTYNVKTSNIEKHNVKTSKMETYNVKTSNIETYNVKTDEEVSTIITSSNIINNNIEPQYRIRPNCTKSAPFLLIDSMQCVDRCSISQREQKNCLINYSDNSKDGK